MSESNYVWRTDSFEVVSIKNTKYYYQNDSFVVHRTFTIPNWKFSDTESYSIHYYDPSFRLVRYESFSKMPRDRYGRYIRDDYFFDENGRLKQQITYKNWNTVSEISEDEYHDVEGLKIHRAYKVPYEPINYSKTYYDDKGRSMIQYSGLDSTGNWKDTADPRNSKWKGPIPVSLLSCDSSVRDIIPVYDSHERLKEVLYVQEGNVVQKSINYNYDTNGRLLESNAIVLPADTIYQELSFYDERGNVYEQKIQNTLITLPSDPVKVTKVKQRKTFVYDEMNKLLCLTEYDGINEEPKISTYTYDSMGNIIEHKIIWNGRPWSLERYTYEY